MPHNFVNYYIAFRHSALASRLLHASPLFAAGKLPINSLKKSAFARRYLAALLAPVLVAGVMQVTWPFFQHSPVLPYVLAVMFCAWYGRLGPGLLSVAVSFLLTDFFFIEPYFSFGIPKRTDLIKLLLFAVVGLFISVICELMHRERRRAEIHEDRLRQSERQLAEAQRIANIGSWSWNLNSETPIWSDELYRIYGLQLGQVAATYEDFFERVHLDDRMRIKEVVERCTRTREPIDLHFRITRPDGEERIIHSRGRIVYDDQAAPIERLGTAQDVTEHWRAQEALREAEKKYRDIFENAVEGVFQSTPDGQFITVNPAYAYMLGYDSPEELLRSRTDIARQHYVEPERRSEFKQLLEECGVVREFEHRAYCKDGRKIWLSENVRTVCDVNGVVLYYEGFTEDITARKQAEESLKVFRNLIDQSSDAIEVLDPSTLRFLDCNATAHQRLGYTREEFLSLTAFDIDPIINQSTIAQVAEEMDKSSFVIFESVHRQKDGSTFPVEINAKTIRLERDYRLAVVRDITERKRAEEKLRESEERYRDLVENSREFISTHDLDGRVLAANRAAAEALGYESGELLKGKNIRDMLAPEVRHEFEPYMAGLREHGATSGVMLVVTSTGERRLWEYYNSLRTEGVATPIVRGIARDITERREAEKAVRVSERKYRDIFSFAPLGICQSLPDGKLITANKALATMLGYDSVNELLKLKLDSDVYFVAGERQELIRTYEPRGQAVDIEFQLKRKDGSPIWVQLNAHVVKGPGGATQYFEAFVRDITERKRAEEKLKATTEQLRALSASLQSAREEEGTRIARELHDELGSALTTLRWNLDEIDSLLPTDTPKEDTATLREKIATMTKLAEGTLQTVRRISSELRPGILDNVGLVAAIEWEAQQFQARSGIVCYLTSAVARLQLTSAQSTAIFRIFQEALTNVLRHASATRVDVSIMKEESELVLTIKDNGRGITDEEKSGAQSLGLVGMRERAYLIGGEVSVAGFESQGTMVTVRMPLKLIRAAGSTRPRTP